MSGERIKMHLVECVAAGIPVRDGCIQRHPYQRDSQSGAGNCVCGRPDDHGIHQGQRLTVNPPVESREFGEAS